MDKLKISLAAARVNAELTQEEVAKKLGVSNKTIINWEKGAVIPSFANLYALCGLYNIPQDNILLPKKST